MRDDRLNPIPANNAQRDFYIKYTDGDQELINVSDDEDLRTAYDVAKKELKGNLKFEVGFKKANAALPIQKEEEKKESAKVESKEAKTTTKPSKDEEKKKKDIAKKEKTDKKEKVKSEKKAEKEAKKEAKKAKTSEKTKKVKDESTPTEDILAKTTLQP